MDAILSNISKVPSAILTSFDLVCQVTKQVSYNFFSLNVQNCYERRADLGFLKTNIAKPILFALEAKRFFYPNVVLRKTELGLMDLSKTVKSFAELSSAVPAPLYKLFEFFKIVVLEGRSIEPADIERHFLFLSNARMGVGEAILRNVVTGAKFFKDFSEGFSFISKKILNNASLVDYAPRISRVLSWAIDNRVACAASLISAFYELKGTTLSDMQAAVKNLKSGQQLNRSQAELVGRVLQGVGSLFIAGSILSKIFNERVSHSRALGFCSLAINGASVGLGVLANRWKIAMPKS